MARRPSALRPAPVLDGGDPTFSIADLPPCKGGLSRREFCAIAGTGLASLSLSACAPADPRIVVGDGVDGTPTSNTSKGPPVPDGGGGSDAAPGSDLAQKGDGATGPADLSHGGTTTCPSGGTSGGLASAIAVGSAKLLTGAGGKLFLCRDASGLYAMSAACTHAGVTIQKKTSDFWCPAHGATFDLNGGSPTSPAFSPLDHYAVCVDSGGNVVIDDSTIVAATTRA